MALSVAEMAETSGRLSLCLALSIAEIAENSGYVSIPGTFSG